LGFDYGVQAGDAWSKYIEYPTEGEFTALIDADITPYKVGYTIDDEVYVKTISKVCKSEGIEEYDAKNFPNRGYRALLETEGFQDAISRIHYLINSWIDGSGADSAKFYLSGKTNFRDRIAILRKYKGKRNPFKPPFFYELRRYVTETYLPKFSHECEGDDDMSIEQYAHLVKYDFEGNTVISDMSGTIIITIDKDLWIPPGWHYNPDTRVKSFTTVLGELDPVYEDKEVKAYQMWPLVDKEPVSPEFVESLGLTPDTFTRGARAGEIKTKRMQVGTEISQKMKKLAGSGLKFFYAQMIMGDDTDGYQGIPGVGMSSAYAALNTCKTEKELYETTLQMYKDKYTGGENGYCTIDNYRGGTTKMTAYQLMLEQGRLAWMQSYQGELWRAKSFCPDGENLCWRR